MTTAPDAFPPSEFDAWANQYDEDVAGEGFPFLGYSRALAEVVRQADAHPSMAVLDLGAGTGNLAELFVRLGCSLWCTDFSTEMLARAREKVPTAQCLVHDLRQPLPPELDRRFDRIVSAYVFHHFELSEKVSILRRLASRHLAQNGRIVIADLSFQTPQALQAARQAAGDAWDEEPYWIAQAALPALEKVGLAAAYTQVSEVAGVYQVSARENPVSPF